MIWPLKFGARYWTRHWSIVVGIVGGGLVLPAVWHDIHAWRFNSEQRRQEAIPIIAHTSVLVSAGANEAVIHVKGERLRGDECEEGDIAAYVLAAGRAPLLANVERVGEVKLKPTNRPRGPFDGGLFRVWPIEGSQTVLIQQQYTCAGHRVRATLAQVSLYAIR